MPRQKILARKSYESDHDLTRGLVNDCEYIVEKVINSSVRSKKRFFLVKWQGWPPSWNTWEPIENLAGAQKAVADYWKAVKSMKKCHQKTKCKGTSPSPTKNDSNNNNKKRSSESTTDNVKEKGQKVDAPSEKVGKSLVSVKSTVSGSSSSPSSNFSSDSSESSSDEVESDSEILLNALKSINVSNNVPVGKLPEKICGMTYKFGPTALVVQWKGESVCEVVYAEPFETAFPDLVSNWISKNSNNTN